MQLALPEPIKEVEVSNERMSIVLPSKSPQIKKTNKDSGLLVSLKKVSKSPDTLANK